MKPFYRIISAAPVCQGAAINETVESACPMRVSFFPNNPHWDVNPSLALLRRAVQELGVTVVKPPGDGLRVRWLWTQRGQVDVLHFHWIQYHYRPAGQPGSTWHLTKFAAKLLLARLLGYRLVWTLHNVLPHERAAGRVDEQARWLMARLAHAVLLYCEAARATFTPAARHKVWVTGTGAFDAPPLDAARQFEARASLGLPATAFVFLYFGFIRRYKRVPDLVCTFSSLPGAHLRLLLAGDIQDQAIGAELAPLLRNDERIGAEFGYAAAARLHLLLAAADVVVLPFAQILSSGSALMALAAGRPVVAPALGCLPEWITPECGLLYDPAQPDGLRQALAAIQQRDIPAMQRAAQAHAADFRWDAAAQITLAAYHPASSNRSA